MTNKKDNNESFLHNFFILDVPRNIWCQVSASNISEYVSDEEVEKEDEKKDATIGDKRGKPNKAAKSFIEKIDIH
ncbi:hypothetical protein BpHYR1_025768 [Brachionus plicatilis]|uniref:Uncharacterized protein n=1 Tax=Brachionus plicatilis TaxID=10195 RepID=A0A3M7S060_BRAPC|nr:hypothetical protein BpHYR1_025768 [Brachionus plicatilis]